MPCFDDLLEDVRRGWRWCGKTVRTERVRYPYFSLVQLGTILLWGVTAVTLLDLATLLVCSGHWRTVGFMCQMIDGSVLWVVAAA